MAELEQEVHNNLVLNEVPTHDLSRLLPHMQIKEVDAKEILHQAGEPLHYIYFPTTALMSMLMPTSEGATVELATVGREGFTDISSVLNRAGAHENGALAKVVTVLPGTVIRMKSDAFEAAVASNLSVARCIRRYVSLLFTELALSVTCNRLHSLEQRCARWLLTAMDKSGTRTMPVTQEMLADILGVYRQSVVQVVSDFEAKGLIQGGRGSIKVESPPRLAAMVCECYFVSKKRAGRS
ncbi:Crp/Fnr family transcriptional regulator [Nitrospira moscoviensis]|uniref:Putative Transcriptional regulator, Crp/Fnr family n=1 Tax=Nitrospira moscoviensis TaxID=42253 RepID=A0A0K2GFD1_NITMO|nr:Crp/Fnr family transcriptional regulator [Nitrospira moscoviensis]ALA59670.1 putative Transcriptional regulator, Crp/Fnr family [Nitrospira moscoviensis]